MDLRVGENMKKTKLTSWRIGVIVVLSILILAFIVIILTQIIKPDEEKKQENNDYEIEHQYDDMYYQSYTKDEVMEAYQNVVNQVDINDRTSLSEHTELISMLVIKTMNLNQEDIEHIDEETQKSIMNYCILGYQARGIDLEPLTLLFMGKYETMVREGAIDGIILPTPDQEDQIGIQE